MRQPPRPPHVQINPPHHTAPHRTHLHNYISSVALFEGDDEGDEISMTLTGRQLRRRGPIAALLLLLLLAFSTVGASAATSVAPFAGAVTAPNGGVWLPGPTGSPGHLWISDSALGFCRVDLAGLAACSTSAKTPGQPSYDPVTSSVYVPDWSATSLGVYRLHFNQATETIDAATLLRPTDGLGNNHPTTTALDPISGALYVGFARSPNIVRISNPSVGVGDPKAVIGNSSDNKQTLSMAFLNVNGTPRLVEADSRGMGQIINPAACLSNCNATPMGLGILGPLSVISDGAAAPISAPPPACSTSTPCRPSRPATRASTPPASPT